jgi:hypothetical protein
MAALAGAAGAVAPRACHLLDRQRPVFLSLKQFSEFHGKSLS